MRISIVLRSLAFLLLLCVGMSFAGIPYVIVGTGQTKCYDNQGEIDASKPGQPFYGQDAQHPGVAPSYRDNTDGTITDLNTGLMWVKARGAQATWKEAVAGATKCRVGGHTDWRATIKELYSLINFMGGFHFSAANSIPYLDTKYFDFVYGDEARGERGIDCQDWSSIGYIGAETNNGAKAFGVNFADGRIKGYGLLDPRSGGQKKMYIRYVRGNTNYGKNDFHDNADGTITDHATALIWSKSDSGKGMNWQESLAWVQSRNKEKYLGYNDWRIPNAKELQSIVDYSRAPLATDSARRGPAIDPIFQTTKLTDGEYPFYWTGTTHLDGPPDRQGGAAIYISFGRATGWMQPRAAGGPPVEGPPRPEGPGLGSGGRPPSNRPRPDRNRGMDQKATDGSGSYRLVDVHGAGAQRSDPKTGDPADFPHGRGPQGDVIRIMNYVRLVRSATE